jgi:mannose-6-phosphate isomerase-like protein (cupin superfamily)
MRHGEYGSMDVRNLSEVVAFRTKDGSEIRELLAPGNSVIRHQSLAEARLPEGGATLEHYHRQTEEIYFIMSGQGLMRVDGSVRSVHPGDAIAIPPGARHKLWNTGHEPLALLCGCAPAYTDEDTVLTETAPGN